MDKGNLRAQDLQRNREKQKSTLIELGVSFSNMEGVSLSDSKNLNKRKNITRVYFISFKTLCFTNGEYEGKCEYDECFMSKRYVALSLSKAENSSER